MGGVRGGPTQTKVATVAVALGLVAFGTHYVLTFALPRLDGVAPVDDKKDDGKLGRLRDAPRGSQHHPGDDETPSPIPIPAPHAPRAMLVTDWGNTEYAII